MITQVQEANELTLFLACSRKCASSRKVIGSSSDSHKLLQSVEGVLGECKASMIGLVGIQASTIQILQS